MIFDICLGFLLFCCHTTWKFHVFFLKQAKDLCIISLTREKREIHRWKGVLPLKDTHKTLKENKRETTDKKLKKDDQVPWNKKWRPPVKALTRSSWRSLASAEHQRTHSSATTCRMSWHLALCHYKHIHSGASIFPMPSEWWESWGLSWFSLATFLLLGATSLKNYWYWPGAPLGPDTAGTNTWDKEVLDGFFSLITKGAESQVRKTMLGKAVSSPTLIFHRKPNENFGP